MKAMNNILLVRVPATDIDYLRELRDHIQESLCGGILVLPDDAPCEVMELPALGRVEVAAPQEAQALPEVSEPRGPAEEKRAIVQRLKDYRAAHGSGCLAAVSAKTAHRKDQRISDDVLRSICADGAPKMTMEDWRNIGRALDSLEGKGD